MSQNNAKLFYESLGGKSDYLYNNQKIKIKLSNNYLKTEKYQFYKSKNKDIYNFMYKIDDESNKNKIFDLKFVKENKNKASLIINNKQYNLSEKIQNGENFIFKLKLKLYD